jgi:hypothetical protein
MDVPQLGHELLPHELGLIDEIDLHLVPVLLGEGNPMSAVNVRYRAATLWTVSE